MSPLLIFCDHRFNTISPEKNKKQQQINTHPWSFFRHRMENYTFLCRGAWNLFSRFFWYAESDDVIFIKVAWCFGGISPFLKIGQILIGLSLLMGKTKFDEFHIFWRSIKICFFWCIYCYQDSVSYSFGYYWAASVLTYSSLTRTACL
jgi:hypothetical protein